MEDCIELPPKMKYMTAIYYVWLRWNTMKKFNILYAFEFFWESGPKFLLHEIQTSTSPSLVFICAYTDLNFAQGIAMS